MLYNFEVTEIFGDIYKSFNKIVDILIWSWCDYSILTLNLTVERSSTIITEVKWFNLHILAEQNDTDKYQTMTYHT